MQNVFHRVVNKYYEINYDPNNKEIMSNDNSAYYTETLSYPMIAFLMRIGEIKFSNYLLEPLSNIKWKDINQQFSNDYDKSIEFVLSSIQKNNFDIVQIKIEIEKLYKNICQLRLGFYGPKKQPPQAY